VSLLEPRKGSKPESYRREVPLRDDSSEAIQGRFSPGEVKAIWALPMAIFGSLHDPEGVSAPIGIGRGGYASGPTLLAASLSG